MLNKGASHCACTCKISRVTNILTATMNGAIHSETAFHESRDSFHSHCDDVKKIGRRLCISFAGRRERNVADPSPLIRRDIRSRKWVITKGRVFSRSPCSLCLYHVFLFPVSRTSSIYFLPPSNCTSCAIILPFLLSHSVSFTLLSYFYHVNFSSPFNAHHK